MSCIYEDMNRIIKFFLSIALIFYFSGNVNANSGKGSMEGRVKDAGSGETLPGAHVLIKGTSFGTSTNIDGFYQINNVSSGEYTIVASSIGYETNSKSVRLESGQRIKIDFELKPIAFEGEEAVITVQRRGQNKAINQQLTSDVIKNVLSSERILEIPDANAAESISRLPGISLTRESGEGSAVIIRGLAPKYNKVTVNGIDLATSAADERSANLSMISSENLAGIEVLKTNLPSMSADAIGGSVNMLIAKAKQEPVYMTRWYGSYNTLEQDLGQYKGFVKVSQRFLKDKLGVQASINIEKKNLSRDRLTASFGQSTQADGSIEYDIRNVSAVDRLQTRKRKGATVILDYGNDRNNIRFWNFLNQKNDDIINNKHSLGSSATSAQIESNISDRTNNMLVNALSGENKLLNFDIDWSLSHSYSKNTTAFNYQVAFAEDHSDKPNVRLRPEEFVAQLKPDSAASFQSFNNNSSNTEDRRYSAVLNFKRSLNMGTDFSGFIQFGGKYQIVNKQNKRIYNQLSNSNFPYPLSDINEWFDPDYVPRNFLGGATTVGITLDPEVTRGYYALISSQEYQDEHPEAWGSTAWMGANDTYEITERVAAAYVMGKMNYRQFANLIFGLRYESDNNDYLANYRLQRGGNPFPLGLMEAQTANVKNDYWFPMASLKIKPLDWFDARFSVSKTMSRPDFLWLIPADDRSTSPDSDITKGDPYLHSAISQNYDLYLSAYNPRLGLLTFGVFSKKIDNITYKIQPYLATVEEAERWGIEERDGVQTKRFLDIPVNSPDVSTVQGFEIDVQGTFAFLPGFLKGFIFHGNYTRMYSSSYLPFRNVETDYSDPRNPKEIRTAGFREGPMPGQAADLINITLGYDWKEIVSIRISYNHQGKTLDIYGVGLSPESDRYVSAYSGLDISGKIVIGKHVSVLFNGTNITNSSVSHTQSSTTKYRLLEHYGAFYSLGIQLNL